MRYHTSQNRSNTQQGAALITALIFLVILTLLAITSMSTNTLEEKMAANSQEINRAFQTAETGLKLAFTDEAAFSTANTKTTDGTVDDPYDKEENDIGDYAAATAYNAVFRQETKPPRGSGWDSTMSFYYFDLSSTGSTASGATTTLHSGAYQVGKASS